jgi:hypothetical protein
MSGKGFQASFVEFGYLQFFVVTRADLTYQEGIERMWTQSTRFDFFTPELESIGEQETYTYELFYTDETSGIDGTTNQTIFGYNPRYEQYRMQKSQITGRFRSNATATFDPWHLSRVFGSAPSLNSTFMEETAPMTRIKATSGDPDYLLDSYFDLVATRPMKMYGVPFRLSF